MPALREKLSSLFHSKLYQISFNSFSSSQKSNAISDLNETLKYLSGNNVEELFKYFCLQSQSGKSLFSNLEYKEKMVIKRIQLMHSIAGKYKSSLLSLVSGIYSRKDLKNIGFNFSNTQYHTAMKKVKSENFVLADYKRSIPKSKKLVSQDTITLITNYLQSNSRNSTVTTNQNIPIYYLEKTKKEIYN